MRLGVRISIYDDRDNEVAHEAVWVPTSEADLAEWRPTYDAVCASIWEAVGRLSGHSVLHAAPAAPALASNPPAGIPS